MVGKINRSSNIRLAREYEWHQLSSRRRSLQTRTSGDSHLDSNLYARAKARYVVDSDELCTCIQKAITSKLALVRLPLLRWLEGQLCCRFRLICCEFWLVCFGFLLLCSSHYFGPSRPIIHRALHGLFFKIDSTCVTATCTGARRPAMLYVLADMCCIHKITKQKCHLYD